ncbi:DotA/TraY family protein [Pseudoalteromonas nigrifaciens]|uniref:DotA/TraY family protein n=1 Tax=Pseudoalteromonas nigrifaciens TaxID=28109 RepID=UPI0017886C2B|nr:DotA/TraY family protein [Pseudoalteromonas nigrifaciens]MBE0420513.1 DotA/TraY family protein [Pseudoalteromonas nigrifaciens]
MKKYSFWLYVILLVGLSLTPTTVIAANEEPDNNGLVIADQDLLMQGVQGLVGSAANIITGGDTPSSPDHLIAELMQTYNFGLMSFAIIFMLFRGAKWFLQLSAQKKDEGVLDFQSAPLPIALAVILMMPLPDGYSSIQHLILKVVGLSISLANEEVNVAADYLDRVGTFALNPTVMATDKIALKMVENAICMAALNKSTGKTNVEVNAEHVRDLDDNIDVYTFSYDGAYGRASAAAGYFADMASFGANGVTKHYPKEVCGTASLSFGAIDAHYVDQEPVIRFRDNIIRSYEALAEETAIIGAKFVDELFDPIGQNASGTHAYNTSYNPSIPADIERVSEKFIMAYRRDLEQLLNEIETSSDDANSGLGNKKATDSLRKYGAAYLGAYFWEFAKRNNVVAGLTSVSNSGKTPLFNEVQETVHETLFESLTDNQQSLFAAFIERQNDGKPDYSSATYIQKVGNLQAEVEESLKNSKHEFDVGADYLFRFATESMYAESDPILALADTGHQFIVIGEIMLLKTGQALAAIKLVQAASEGLALGLTSVPVFGTAAAAPWALAVSLDIAAAAASTIIPIAITMIVFGALIAFWLPSIPLIHWVSGTVGFMIVFMQAFILTPLLGLAHLLSGEKGFFSSKTQHGYMAIIQLFTYFPIMVIAFFVSYLICMFGLKFLQVIYLPFMTSLNGNSIAGIVTFIMLVAVYIIISMQIMNRCFSLVTTLTDKAGKFIGGGEEMLGDNSAADKGHGTFVAFSNQMKSGMGSTTANAVGGKQPKKNPNNQNGTNDTGDIKDTGKAKNINSKTK